MPIKLDGTKETLMLPLWGRAFETKKSNPYFIDMKALEIIENIDYDFSSIEKHINPLSRASWIARSIYFDNLIRQFLEIYPQASIINIGCGLDTTFDRVNNNRAKWYEIDFPEVIDLRRKYIEECSNRIFLPHSVFDNLWYEKIENKKEVFLMIAGVIYYFEESQVKKLFQSISEEFEGCEIAFDYSSPRGVRIANKKVIERGGMDKSAYLKWGIKNIYELEKWNPKMKILENMKMFDDYKKRYPLGKRIGMAISDALSIMSLVHIRIE
jgi:O-methyltransferase involved in polyketide biosynthesis